MRQRLRSPQGKIRYRRRQALVEPVFGILKEQRGMRGVRLRGLGKVELKSPSPAPLLISSHVAIAVSGRTENSNHRSPASGELNRGLPARGELNRDLRAITRHLH